jgi:hypothetical protein
VTALQGPFPAAPFNVAFAVNPPQEVSEGSSCVVAAAFTDSTGAALIPASITYRIDDLDSGAVILGATAVTPAASVSITVTAAQNALLSDTLACEQHQLTLTATDGNGDSVNAPVRWGVERIFPLIT